MSGVALRLAALAVFVAGTNIALSQTPGDAPANDAGLTEQLRRADELRAARNCREALDIYRDAAAGVNPQDQATAWQVHLGLASCLLSLGNQEEAAAEIPLLKVLSGSDAARLTRTARFEAGLLHRQGRLQEAEEASLRAVEVATASNDPILEIDAYSMLATVYSLQGRNREATDIDERLLAMERGLDRGAKPLAAALNELAIDYRRFGRYDDGLALLGEALQLYRSENDAEGQAMVLYNTAQVYADNGDTANAFAMYREALNYAEQVGHAYGLGLLHTELGGLLAKSGNTAAGRTHLQRSLDINRGAKLAYGEMLALMGLGYLERTAANLADSRNHLEAAVTLADERGFGGLQAFARIELALTLAEDDAAERGLELLDRARSLGEEQGDVRVLFETAAARGRVLERAGRRPQAIAQYLLAIDMLESMRGRMLLGDLLVSVPERYWHVYEGAIRALAGEQRAWDAFLVSERARARMLLEVLANRNLEQKTNSEKLRLRGDLMAIGAALETAGSTQKPALETEAAALEARLRSLDERNRTANATAVAVAFPLSVDLASLREKVLRPGTVLLSYFWGEEEVYAWRIDGETVRLVNLGPAVALEAQVEFLQAAVEQRQASVDWRPASALAYRNMLAPLVDASTDMIFVVADGPLLSLPLDVLQREESADPLGTSVPVVYVPSANVVVALAGRSGRVTATKSMLALGVSVQGGGPYAPLPLAAREARDVFSLYDRDDALLLTDRDASLDAWLAAAPENYRMLHFATHAIIDEQHPEKSHLVFSESRLDLTTIRQLRFNAELVTLSACETAVGRHWRGEGMVGLAHAFLESGTQSLLASAWRVDDRYTAEFMREFYARLEAGHAPISSLLKIRQDWIRRADAYAHPGNWGAFIFIGWPSAGQVSENPN